MNDKRPFGASPCSPGLTLTPALSVRSPVLASNQYALDDYSYFTMEFDWSDFACS